MPDKLTDSEIVKALECCLSEGYTCKECAYHDGKHYDRKNGFEIMPNGMTYDQLSCDEWLKMGCLDLINRLQARVEKCEKVEHFADKTIATLQAENERLSAKSRDNDRCIKTLKDDLNLTKEDIEFKIAENERLRKAIEKTDYAYFKKSCEFDNLIYDFELLKQEKSVVKAEAYKEFAEKLKKEALIDSGYEVLQSGTIDNLLKELVGVDNA